MADVVRASAGALSRHDAASGQLQEFLAFILAGELYGLGLEKVREIVTPPPITPVPRAPREIIGVCSVRGQLTTVIDLRCRLNLETAKATARTRILLADAGDEVVGLLVDEVRHVVRLPATAIELASHALGGETSEYVRGIGRPAKDEVMVLLDAKSVVRGAGR